MCDQEESIHCQSCGVEITVVYEGPLDGKKLCADCHQEEEMIILDHFIT